MPLWTPASRRSIRSEVEKMAKTKLNKAPNEVKKRGMWSELWRNYKKSPSAMLGLVVVGIIIVLAVWAQFAYDYNTDIVEQHIKERFQEPNSEHWLGTDQYGRDVLTRILYGAKYSLSVGLVSMAIACSVGSSLGLIAGYYGGWIENIILRTCEVFVGIPTILLGVAIMTAFGQSLGVLMWAIGLVYVPLFARTARAAVLPVRAEEYIEAARMAGVSDMGIIFKHILPNSLSPIIVRTTMGVASGILSASSLSFLGMGVPVPAPEWGAMLSNGREFIRDHSYLTLFPGLAIMITVLAFNLVGDGLRDALDPKLKRKG